MTWLEHHKTSECYAQLADDAAHQQNSQQAQILYAQAAQAEHLALTDLDPSKTKTLGIPRTPSRYMAAAKLRTRDRQLTS